MLQSSRAEAPRVFESSLKMNQQQSAIYSPFEFRVPSRRFAFEHDRAFDGDIASPTGRPRVLGFTPNLPIAARDYSDVRIARRHAWRAAESIFGTGRTDT